MKMTGKHGGNPTHEAAAGNNMGGEYGNGLDAGRLPNPYRRVDQGNEYGKFLAESTHNFLGEHPMIGPGDQGSPHKSKATAQVQPDAAKLGYRFPTRDGANPISDNEHWTRRNQKDTMKPLSKAKRG